MFFHYQHVFVVCWGGILLEFLAHVLMLNNLQIMTSCFCQLSFCYWYSCQFYYLFGVCCKSNYGLFSCCFKFCSLVGKFLLFLVFHSCYLLFHFVVIVRTQPWQCCYLLNRIRIHEFSFLSLIFLKCWRRMDIILPSFIVFIALIPPPPSFLQN